jgi:adenine deaminase|tara:strand:- start:350 stop:2149 length:1800 start_codon:yes stop_codon:yes gene_type:complete
MGLQREALIDVAMGYEPADKVIKNCRIVNSHTGTIHQPSDNVAIKGERIAAIGDMDYTIGDDTEVIDADGRYLVPGLIDPHCHQWHTYANSTVFAACRLLHGSTTIVDGFYGHAIVNGLRASRFFLDELLRTPVKPLFVVPTMCYTQNRGIGFPASPNAPSIDQLMDSLSWPETKGIEEISPELMLYRNQRDADLLNLMEECLKQGKVIQGHSAGMTDDKITNAWVSSGIMHNHEVVNAAETRRQAELGIWVVIREGSACTDIEACIPVITKEGYDPRAFQLCTDVITPDWMLERGQMDNAIRVGIKNGLDPMTAIQMSTIQPAEFYRVNHDMGMIAPGRYADIVFVENLEEFEISQVMANGKIWVKDGKLVEPLENPDYPDWLYGTMNIDRVLAPEDFQIKAPEGAGDTVKVQVINTRDGSLETPGSVETLKVVDGLVQADPVSGINKICMIDRIMGTGEIGLAFVKGFNIQEGCIGTTANVFNQNIVLVGASDEDMAAAANETIDMDGGFIALRNGEVLASLPTPLNGLASDLPFNELFEKQFKLIAAWRDMGCELETPQMNLEFVSLVTIPYYRISTKGLAYMTQDRFELAELFVQ